MGTKLISDLLDSTRVDHSPEAYYVGLRALRIILDPESGFQRFASSRSDPDFEAAIRDLPFDLMPSISVIYEYMDAHIGLRVCPTNGQVLEFLDDKRDHSGAIDPDESTVSPLKILSQPAHAGSADDLENGMSPQLATAGSPLRKNPPEVSTSSPSLRRGSLLSSSPSLVAPSSLTDINNDQQDTDQFIAEIIVSWFDAAGAKRKAISKYSQSSSLTDQQKLRRNEAMRFKPEQKQAMALLQELTLIIQFAPTPELLGAKFFIGEFLNHYREDLALEVANAFINIFKNFPDLRLGYQLINQNCERFRELSQEYNDSRRYFNVHKCEPAIEADQNLDSGI